MTELTAAISKSHDMAAGPDDIDYQMLKHLPAACCFGYFVTYLK